MNSKSKMKDHEYKSSSNGVYSNKISTGIYELTLELKNKLKTQAKQSKNSPKKLSQATCV